MVAEFVATGRLSTRRFQTFEAGNTGQSRAPGRVGEAAETGAAATSATRDASATAGRATRETSETSMPPCCPIAGELVPGTIGPGRWECWADAVPLFSGPRTARWPGRSMRLRRGCRPPG